MILSCRRPSLDAIGGLGQQGAARWCSAIKDLHFHDLRGTAVTMLAEAGCSNAEIAAITGHSMQHVETILTKYVSLTRDLAQSAMAKLENAGSDFSGLV